MTTTEMIDLLKSVEYGGVSKRPRNISFHIGDSGVYMDPEIKISGTGDGIAGAELYLLLSGGEFLDDEDTELKEEEQPKKPLSITGIIEEVKSEICDAYCKYLDEWRGSDSDELPEECLNCPLGRLWEVAG